MQPSATAHASRFAMSSPTVTSNDAVGALRVTLHKNFSQIIRSMSSKALDVEAGGAPELLDPLRRRSVMPPAISPMRISRMPLWCTAPGWGIEDPNPSAMPIMIWSSGTWRATRSAAPRPFWNGITTSSGRTSGAISRATVSTSAALVAMTQRSHGPASAGLEPTWRFDTV